MFHGFVFGKYSGLNSGLFAWQTDTLPFEPHLQSLTFHFKSNYLLCILEREVGEKNLFEPWLLKFKFK
jgi:hypothetical protein